VTIGDRWRQPACAQLFFDDSDWLNYPTPPVYNWYEDDRCVARTYGPDHSLTGTMVEYDELGRMYKCTAFGGCVDYYEVGTERRLFRVHCSDIVNSLGEGAWLAGVTFHMAATEDYNRKTVIRSMTFPPTHDNYGEVHRLDVDSPQNCVPDLFDMKGYETLPLRELTIAIEFESWHPEHGRKERRGAPNRPGKLVRTTHDAPHRDAGLTVNYNQHEKVKSMLFATGVYRDPAMWGQCRHFDTDGHWHTTSYPCRTDPKHGHLDRILQGRKYLTEYVKSHPKHGVLRCYDTETGEHIRTEYAEAHPSHGEVRWVENRKHVRSTWRAPHPAHGRVAFMNEHQELDRYEFLPSHPRCGQIVYYTFSGEGGADRFVRQRVERTEYDDKHPQHGVVRWQTAEGNVYKISYKAPHRCVGMVLHYDGVDRITRITHEAGHQRHGEVLVWDGCGPTHMEYEDFHPLHGQTHEISTKDRREMRRFWDCNRSFDKNLVFGKRNTAGRMDAGTKSIGKMNGDAERLREEIIREAYSSESCYKRAFSMIAMEMSPSNLATPLLRLLRNAIVDAPELSFPRVTASSQLLGHELTADDGLGRAIRECWLLEPVVVDDTEPVDAVISPKITESHPNWERAQEELRLFKDIRTALKKDVEKNWERLEQSQQRKEELSRKKIAAETDALILASETKQLQRQADAEHKAKRQAEAKAEKERMEARRAEIAQQKREQELSEKNAKATANAASRVDRAEAKLKEVLDKIKVSEFNTAAGKARTAGNSKGKHKAQTPAALARSPEEQRQHTKFVDPKERKAREAVAEAKKLLAAAERAEREYKEKMARDTAERIRREARAVEEEHRPPAAAAVGAVLAEATARATPLGQAVARM
jgi:hypothetical protein